MDNNIDRVTRSYLEEFKKKFSFEKLNDNDAFENYVNYTILDSKIVSSLNNDLLTDINIGKNSTIGIDGFALIINGDLISDIIQLEDVLSIQKGASCEIYFIQSKISNTFKSSDILSFGNAVFDFTSEKNKLTWSSNSLQKIEIFNKLLEKSSSLNQNPKCYLYYVTLGVDQEDNNVYSIRDSVINNLKTLNVFSSINFEFIDCHKLQKMYKSISQKLTKRFRFSSGANVMLPDISNVKESYLGYIDAKTALGLVTDDSNKLIPYVFYDNVRDFQGINNNVNNEIRKTLISEHKDEFLILNNGITIVAEDCNRVRDEFEITNFQIVNGCQTMNVLYNNLEYIGELVKVPIKLIVSSDQDLVERIICSTNRQTAIKEQDLIAYSDFQKRLEDFYKTFKENKLYYERRSKQYNSLPIDKSLIIDKTLQVKVVGSFYFDKPTLATRYFGKLFNEFRGKIFERDHKLIIYYLPSLIYYKINKLFQESFLETKYRKIRFFILTMLKYELNKQEIPRFNSKDAEKYCNEIINIVNDDKRFIGLINSVIIKIDKSGINLNSTEVSKSIDEFDKCMIFYQQYRPTKK